MATQIKLRKRFKFSGDVLTALIGIEGWDWQKATKFLNRIADSDAVEVVRCKDCKNYDVFRLECHNGHMNGYIGIDGFCSYGERKEKGDGRT